MGPFLTVLEAWWSESPLLTALGVAAVAVLVPLLLLILAIIVSPTMRILYRAARRVLWIKFGTTHQGPPLAPRYREFLEEKKLQELIMTAEGAAFGRTGVIYLNGEEIGFVSVRYGALLEMNLPYTQITEAKISKGALFDSVTVTTSGRVERLRVYRSDRDVGQEFFNHLQLRLGAVRFHKA
jgi:hypothetical protein